MLLDCLTLAAHYHSHLDRLVLTALRRMWLNVIRFYPQNVFYIEYSFLSITVITNMTVPV